MQVAILKFKLPDDATAHLNAVHGEAWHDVVLAIYQKLSEIVEYSEIEERRAFAREITDELLAEVGNNNLHL